MTREIAQSSIFPVLVEKGRGRSTLYVSQNAPWWTEQGRSQPPQAVVVRVGKRRIRAVVRDGGEETRLSIGVGFPWPLRSPLRLWLRRHPSGDLHVGPVVGILSRPIRRPFFGAQGDLFRRMIREAEGIGVMAFAFFPGAARAGRVVGYRPGRKGTWVRSRFPYPDVVFDRSRRSGLVSATLGRLRAHGTRVFNGRLGTKWRQWRIVRSDPVLQPHVPPTLRLRSPADLRTMLRRYGAVYVKPIAGGQGAGIWRIERAKGGYVARYTDRRARTHGFRTGSLRRVYRSIRRRGSRYIVQPRLQLIRHEGGIADVRVLMQKDGRGVWRMTGAGVRVGGRSGIVSNLSGGGSGYSLDQVLQEAFSHDPGRIPVIKQEIEALAFQLARRFEQRLRILGELGIDLGVDTEGKVWFLEVNSKAGRSLFHRLEAERLGRLADRRPMEYASWLAGFGWDEGTGE